jgi:hypothetical protein
MAAVTRRRMGEGDLSGFRWVSSSPLQILINTSDRSLLARGGLGEIHLKPLKSTSGTADRPPTANVEAR